eukprot:284214_1
MSLVTAAREGDFEKVVHILTTNPDCIDMADIYGETALHESIYNGHDEISIYLLKHGASPILCRNDGDSPLHISANRGRYHVAKTLLEYESVRNTINKKGCLGNTALHGACKKTKVDLVYLLVKNGSNVNYVNKRGQRPIDYTRDVRVQRILRGQKWYDDLDGDAIVDRLKKGQERIIESPNTNKNKKKRRRRGGKNRNKNRIVKQENENNIEMKQQSGIGNSKDKKKHIPKKKLKGDNNVSNKELDMELKTWLDYNDCVSVETQQRYQMIYFDRKLKLKWIHYMRSIRKLELKIMEFNRKMCHFADGLYLEYSQPQYDGNHYIPHQLNEYD